jgi:8-oxo-dGTP pyrophosphatase MutT (NUDIX family)
MLRSLSETLTDYPRFQPQWQARGPGVFAANEPFGVILHAVVCDDMGQPRHDQPVWLEPPHGPICVPVDEDDRIGLLQHHRRVVLPASVTPQYPTLDFTRCGAISWEVPRGFPEPGETPELAAARETREETGLAVREVIPLGRCNVNTTFFPHSLMAFLVRVSASGEAGNLDRAEGIQSVHFFNRSEVLALVADGSIYCALTKAALLNFLAWQERQEQN